VKSILKKFPKTNYYFQGYLNKYMPLTPLKLVLLDMFTNKKSGNSFGQSIIKVNQGKIIMNETVKKI
jgi:hypothetical protein